MQCVKQEDLTRALRKIMWVENMAMKKYQGENVCVPSVFIVFFRPEVRAGGGHGGVLHAQHGALHAAPRFEDAESDPLHAGRPLSLIHI